MKRLVLFCDGTWNTADQKSERSDSQSARTYPCPTNVVRAAYRVAKQDGAVPQIVFYDEGVGTGNWWDKIWGGAAGSGLERNVHDAYRFLIANYEAGDELFLFGFSRGAFTARSIAGMVRKCGILKRERVNRYPDAKRLYHSTTRPADSRAVEFRNENSVGDGAPIKVRFIGVWDTVGSLGIPLPVLRKGHAVKYHFHDAELSGAVENAFHALAIDEHRTPFEPTLWMFKPKEGQRVEQVWFCGVHSDVGGGYVERKLSDIPLRWMLDRAVECGLRLDAAVEAALPMDPGPTAAPHDSMTILYRLIGMVGRRLWKRLGLLDRPMGWSPDPGNSGARIGDPSQTVHPSVRVRWDADPGYRPVNLRDYFTRTGDPRAG